jgi:H+-translocating NAD(P) transhydrogenase subunit beta
VIKVIYLIAAVLFIVGLKEMGRPKTAVRGNILGALGMLIAIAVTFLEVEGNFALIAIGIIIGSAIGVLTSKRIEMTAMPQLVALLNGLGGIASVLVAGAAMRLFRFQEIVNVDEMIATAASGLIGAVTFTGSLVAFGKLQEMKIFWNPWRIPGGTYINAALTIVTLLLSWWLVETQSELAYWSVVVVASVLGVLLVCPIGGADMPVVIALLNSYSGIAAAATGFVLDNYVLIISGSLVGASGIILTQIMCKAMNRSITNVLFGVMDGGGSVGDAKEIYAKVRSTSAEDISMILDTAQRVVIIPGYGMAVAQAQHALRDMASILEKKGIEVEYGIHPVAGRMPGHMNVLLAEADVSYEKLKDMDQINATISTADVAIVMGANDVVNPSARTDPNSPIAGMPIIDADKARTVIVIKRSLSPGFAKIPNPLFAADNTLMFFSDGKEAVLEIIAALKEL